MDEKAKRGDSGRVNEAQPLAGCEELVRRLHTEAQAGRWALSAEEFCAALERAIASIDREVEVAMRHPGVAWFRPVSHYNAPWERFGPVGLEAK